jgi:hypothetical protein
MTPAQRQVQVVGGHPEHQRTLQGHAKVVGGHL